MPNILSPLNHHIRQQARRDLKPLIVEGKRRSTEHRKAIAALKREVLELRREMASMKKLLPSTPKMLSDVSPTGKAPRLRIDGMKALRKRLGLSAADMGTLLNVSGLTVYNWENKKSLPRRKHLPRIGQVRQLGKKEAHEALRLLKA